MPCRGVNGRSDCRIINQILSMERTFLFVLGSGRRDGNTDLLARAAAAALPAGTPQQWLHLLDLPLAPFEDIRHSAGVYPIPVSHEKTLFEATLEATDVVIVSPLYWYSVSASVKQYLDYWSAWLRVPDAQFRARMKGKTLWAVSVNSSETEAESQAVSAPLVECLRLSADYMDMHWGGALLGMGNRTGDVLKDEQAMAAAPLFFSNH